MLLKPLIAISTYCACIRVQDNSIKGIIISKGFLTTNSLSIIRLASLFSVTSSMGAVIAIGTVIRG